MILLIDNYDSFTYNLYQLCCSFTDSIHIVRNDKISIAEIAYLKPQAIILSPGPKSPFESGICLEAIKTFVSTIPILGVCLGMQAIAAALGGSIVRAPYPMHGKASSIFHSGQFLYNGIPAPMIAGRYHSLLVDKESLPPDLIADAFTEEGLIMGIRHRNYPCYGVQFHPESILTQFGERLLSNFFTILERMVVIPNEKIKI